MPVQLLKLQDALWFACDNTKKGASTSMAALMLRGDKECEFITFLRQHESTHAVQKFCCDLRSFAADEVELPDEPGFVLCAHVSRFLDVLSACMAILAPSNCMPLL